MNTLQALKRIHAGEQQGESLVDAPMLDAAAQVATGAGALVDRADRGDGEALRRAYHADATEDHGPFSGKVADFIPFVLDVLRNVEVCLHMIQNVLIEIEGDVAVSEACFITASIALNTATPRRAARKGRKCGVRAMVRVLLRKEDLDTSGQRFSAAQGPAAQDPIRLARVQIPEFARALHWAFR